MRIPIISILFIILIIMLQLKLRKSGHIGSKKEAYLKRESLASKTRKKSLENLHYYKIDLNALSIPCNATSSILRIYDRIQDYSQLPMVNFDGKDNTELKMEYGVANLTTLITYESTYQNLLHQLYDFAERLYEEGFVKEASLPLIEAIRLDSTMSKHFLLLSTLLNELRDYERLEALLSKVKTMEIHKKDNIIKNITFNMYNS